VRQLLLATIGILSFIGGCTAKEELVARTAVVPVGIDLSGQWQLREDSQDTVRRISEAEMEAAGGTEAIILAPERRQRGSQRLSASGTLVHVFLETGKALKVSQTQYGLFISFDRAVVEEYRFGERREINVGPVIADRVSGWEGSTYIIETLDKDGAKLIESYRLADNGRSLIREVKIVHDGVSQIDVEQVFDRF
jgi:hypothetical protein